MNTRIDNIIKLLKRIYTRENPARKELDHEDLLCQDSRKLHIRNKSFQDVFYAPAIREKETALMPESVKPSNWSVILQYLYKDLHVKSGYRRERKGSYFNGSIFQSFSYEVSSIIEAYDCKSIFDYGCGSADDSTYQWLKPFGISDFGFYDAGIPETDINTNNRKYDIVVCCDVLEHVHISDLGWTLSSIFNKACKVVFLTVSSRKALLRFDKPPHTDQVHITIMPSAWWFGFILAISSSYPGISFYLCVDGPDENGNRQKNWFSNTDVQRHLYNFYSNM